MAEHDPTIGRDIISAVLKAFGWRLTRGVEREDVGRYDLAVKAVGDEVGTNGGGKEPRCIDGFAVSKRDETETGGAQGGYS